MILLTLIGFLIFGTLFWLLKRRDPPPPPPPEPASSARMTLLQRLRRIVGWIFMILGILMFWLPLPLGIPFMMLGAALIGRRDRTLRQLSINVRLLLRRWAKLQIPLIGLIGQKLLHMQQHMSRELRRWRWRRMGLM